MIERPETRKYWREAEARAFVDEHAGSGLSIAAFAAKRGIPAERLKRWRKRLGVRAKMAAAQGTQGAVREAPPVVRMARVERVAAASASGESAARAALTIELGGARVWVPAGFDAPTVRAVLEALVASTRGGAQ